MTSHAATSQEWRRRIAAARYIEPFHQGSLDGLCGLYAIINAITVARWPYHPVRKAEAAQLFETGLYHLNRSTDLVETAAEGMDWATLRCLAKILSLQASMKPVSVEIDRLPYSVPVLARRQAVRRSIAKQQPVIVNIDERSHYSVIIGISETRYYLQDSAGSSWVPQICSKITHAMSVQCRRRVAPA